MKKAELQNSIIQKVLKTEDDQLLNYLNQLLNEGKAAETYLLSDFEKSIIAESQAEYQSGNVVSNQEVISKNTEWLKSNSQKKLITLDDLKTILHQRITKINDQKILSAMITLLDVEPEETIYITSKEQKAKIMEGREQIEQGNFFTNKQVEKEIDEWLGKE